ncbi:hypothetical protein HanPI659440_Chr02g0045531 [Helianthus annuus]|nr:hypothetical protein HanPI659440_Chr02g0045531 [Helianthus annuus]
MLTPRTNALDVPSSSRLTTSNGVNSSRGKMLVLGEKNRTASMSYPTTKHVRSSKNTHRASINKNGKKKLLSAKSPSSRPRVTNGSDCILARNFSSGGIYGHIKAWEGSFASRGSGVEIFVSKLVDLQKLAKDDATLPSCTLHTTAKQVSDLSTYNNQIWVLLNVHPLL